MAKRKIVKITEDKCNGCGLCIPNCAEGAIQMIDGKARLISDLFCDGLGACLGHCPQGAITLEEREAEPYDENKVMEHIIKGGPNVIKAHLEHLRDHGEREYFAQGVEFLKRRGIPLPQLASPCSSGQGGCPGSRMIDLSGSVSQEDEPGARASQLRQWPVQLHLVPPTAPYFKQRDLLLAADCVAYALADFHKDYLQGKALAIACPKLDSEQEIYLGKLVALIDQAKINTLTVMIMEVPCCSGLLRLAEAARQKAKRQVPLKKIVVGIRGDILADQWL